MAKQKLSSIMIGCRLYHLKNGSETRDEQLQKQKSKLFSIFWLSAYLGHKIWSDPNEQTGLI